MKVNHEFEVNRPASAVWDFFQDMRGVASCLPGAELTEDRGDGSYAGTVGVKLGPMHATFEGEAQVTPDAANHSAHIEGKGADRRGGSRGTVKVDYHLEPSGSGTKVVVDANVTLAGAAAQFGRTGIITEMSNRLIAEFVTCLEAKLEAETPEEAAAIEASEVKGFSLFFSSLLAALKRFIAKVFGKSGD